jgi:hypothetical protein
MSEVRRQTEGTCQVQRAQGQMREVRQVLVLRFDGASKPVTADGSTVFDFDLDSPPSKKKGERQPKRRSEKTGQHLSLMAEPWRVAIYQRVTDERFNDNFAAFARIALDTMAEQLGYPVRPSVKATSAD